MAKKETREWGRKDRQVISIRRNKITNIRRVDKEHIRLQVSTYLPTETPFGYRIKTPKSTVYFVEYPSLLPESIQKQLREANISVAWDRLPKEKDPE